MSVKEPDILRDRQLEMVGRLLAGFSHELKNHLAIIKESNGLISDLLGMGRVEDPALRARLEKITGTINKRTLMVAEMAKHLSGFAHRNDVPVCPFQLRDILNEELAFLARSANLKSVGLSLSFSESLPVVCNNPSLVQFVFASLFLSLLPILKAGGTIIVSSGQQDRDIFFGLRVEGKNADTVPALAPIDHDPALREALRRIGARLSVQPTEGRFNSIICTLPLSLEDLD